LGRIVRLFDALLLVRPSPVIALNRAIAVRFRDVYDAGLGQLAVLDGLDAYPSLPAARGDFLRRLGRHQEAGHAYREAMRLTQDGTPERRLLERAWSRSEDDLRHRRETSRQVTGTGRRRTRRR
jgi:RNA polymerase sigma-70 factor, ECF subfamily